MARGPTLLARAGDTGRPPNLRPQAVVSIGERRRIPEKTLKEYLIQILSNALIPIIFFSVISGKSFETWIPLRAKKFT